MFARYFSTAAIVLAATLTAAAQEIWSLERCVQHAIGNNRNVKLSKLDIESQQLTQKQYQLNRLPSLSYSTNLGGQFGFSVDPTTNQFVQSGIGFNSMSLQGGIAIYQGGQIQKGIQQSGYNIQAAEADAQNAANTLALSVATAYLQILLAEEQLANAQKRVELSRQQLERTDRLIAAGTLAPNARFDFVAQVARNEQELVQARNSVDITYLNLKIQLELDPDYQLKVEKPNIAVPAVNTDNIGLKLIYSQALNTQPQIRAGDFRLKSANMGIELAKAARLPTISAFASLDSRYSTLGAYNAGSVTYIDTVEGRINGANADFEFERKFPLYLPSNYFRQFRDNFGQSVGISVRVPIYSNGQNNINIQRAQILAKQQELLNLQTAQQLKGDVQTAIANLKASQKSYEASLKTLEATKAAFENADKRFTVGNINAFELNTARNNLDTAEINLTLAKYEFIFREKILQFYEGKTLRL